MKFVDIKNDVAFRKIFGNENKKEILISFLNAVLELPKGKKIEKIEIKNPFQLPEIKALKSSILDVKVTDERNITYIVEMQVEEPDGFDKRVQYYTAKQYASQIEVGEDYPKLNQVIFIGILNFKFFEGENYLTRHLIINQKNKKQELKDLEFNFIELSKFHEDKIQITTLIEKWIYFLKNSPNLDVIPENVADEGLKQAYQDAAKHNWSKEDLMAYDYASMRKADESSKTKRAVEKAVTEAVEKAVTEEKTGTVKKLYEKGMSLADISEITELSIEQIKDILLF
ncbi:MAG: Rpn family recombination-promoting nuclease/putative transposase [Bacteroidetes bacterium]|nr:Rpn family recombination-promoting nuclease/putative transposase [Bacteroidota bacterium]